MESLFESSELRDAIENASTELAEAIDALSDESLLKPDEQELLRRLVAEHVLRVPVLDVDAITAAQREMDVDVSQDARRFIDDRSRPFYVKATEIAFSVPFRGDRNLFFCRPSRWSMSPPKAEIGTDSLVVRIVRQDQNAAEYRKAFDQTLAAIKTHLDQIASDCAGVETRLIREAGARLAARKSKRQKDQNLLSELGFKPRAK